MISFFKNTSAQIIIAVLVVVSFFTVIVVLLTRPITLDDHTTSILTVLIGALGNEFAHVVQFFTGSSSGSKDKDALHADILRSLGNNNSSGGAPSGGGQ
jgi:hypothetical protein